MKHVNSGEDLQARSDAVMVKLESSHIKNDEAEAEQAKKEAVARAVEIEDSTLAADVIDALREIYDPEIPVNIYDMGLIYKVQIEAGKAEIDMTLTTPGCPVAQSFPGMIESSIKKVAGIQDAKVNLVWDPPWTQENLSEEARLQLGLI